MNATAGHVFVSHSSDNRELANELAAFIEARGARIWIAPRDVRPGMDYSEQLQLAIESCVAFVVLVTDMANKSPYVRAETEMAFSTNKPIFPVRITDIQPAAGLALFLKIRHWTDAYGPSKSSNLDRLALELQALSRPPASAAAEAPAPAPPSPPPPPPAAPPQSAPIAVAAPVPALPLVPANAEEEEKWRAAVGPRADHYLARWRAMAAKNSAISWNWPACLASLFWFGYRKMWLPMIGVLVISVLLSVIGGANPQAGRAMLLVSIGITFVTGSFGNHLYRRQIARLVAQAQGPDRQAVLAGLKARGGVSMPALVVSLAILGLFVLVVLIAGIQAAQEEQNRMDAQNLLNLQQQQQQDPYSTGEPMPDKPVDEDPPPYDY